MSLVLKTVGFERIRAEPRKPAKLESDGMQGVKERPKEATLTTMQTTLYGCGLEGGDRPRAERGGMPKKLLDIRF